MEQTIKNMETTILSMKKELANEKRSTVAVKTLSNVYDLLMMEFKILPPEHPTITQYYSQLEKQIADLKYINDNLIKVKIQELLNGEDYLNVNTLATALNKNYEAIHRAERILERSIKPKL